jgi:Protein of unknown function (DUF2778)
MSTSTVACYNFAAPTPRKPARQSTSQRLLAAAAIGGLVLGAGWTVYANILASSPFPQIGSASSDEPVVLSPADIVARNFPRFDPSRLTVVPETVQSPSQPEPQLSFLDRFAAAAPQGVAPAPRPEAPKIAEAAKPQPAPPAKLADAARSREAAKEAVKETARTQIAAVLPASRSSDPKIDLTKSDPSKSDPPKSGNSLSDMAQRAKNAILSIASADRHSMTEKLWGKGSSRSPVLAYASADASVTGSIERPQNPALGGSAPYERDTAVYDISAHMVYLPDGSRLEAHSGLGPKLDDPGSANVRMRGVTPPHIYELKPRESLFHGVPALRLNPVGGEDAIYGRSGLLAHTYMLGPNGDSNGCVSFKDYNAFLSAYHNQGIRRLAVVARID